MDIQVNDISKIYGAGESRVTALHHANMVTGFVFLGRFNDGGQNLIVGYGGKFNGGIFLAGAVQTNGT